MRSGYRSPKRMQQYYNKLSKKNQMRDINMNSMKTIEKKMIDFEATLPDMQNILYKDLLMRVMNVISWVQKYGCINERDLQLHLYEFFPKYDDGDWEGSLGSGGESK